MEPTGSRGGRGTTPIRVSYWKVIIELGWGINGINDTDSKSLSEQNMKLKQNWKYWAIWLMKSGYILDLSYHTTQLSEIYLVCYLY